MRGRMAYPRMLASLLVLAPLAACNSDPSDVEVTLAPEVISSIDGTLSLEATVYHDTDAKESKTVTVTVDYTDRNGNDQSANAVIETPTGPTDKRGVFATRITGLRWDGAGTVHVTSGDVTTDATFSVLDRSPPVVSITPPTLTVNQDATVTVHVTDEIGVSQVSFETSATGGGNGNRQRTTISNAGTTDADVDFDVGTNNLTAGDTVTIYAVAADLSGNEGVAQPITVTVAP
jgi:hypothetical protein